MTDADGFEAVRAGLRSWFRTPPRRHGEVWYDREVSFLEVKTKRNAEVTDKSRLKLAYPSEALGEAERAFLRAQVGELVDRLEPMLRVEFRRITLIGLVFMAVVAIVNFLTEFTSNLATVTMILPVLAPVAVAAGMHPIVLMAGATMAASCGFMMPAGTPPNAIVFGSGYLRIWDMIKTGFVMNVISILLITVIVYFLLDRLWIF